jgi:hypothetical protein
MAASGHLPAQWLVSRCAPAWDGAESLRRRRHGAQGSSYYECAAIALRAGA